MAELRKAALLAAHNFQKWPVNPRVYVVFLLELAYVHWTVSPVGDFCAQGGYTVGPWVFPFLLAEPYSRLMVMLGLIPRPAAALRPQDLDGGPGAVHCGDVGGVFRGGVPADRAGAAAPRGL